MPAELAIKPDVKAAAELAAGIVRIIITELRNQNEPWSKTPENVQARAIERIKNDVVGITRDAVRTIAGVGFHHFPAQLKSFSIKDSLKANLEIPITAAEIGTLVGCVNQQCLIVMAQMDQYTEGLDAIKADPDEPGLFDEEHQGEDGEEVSEHAAAAEATQSADPAAPSEIVEQSAAEL